MKKAIFILILALLHPLCPAQDLLYFKNNTKLTVRVLEQNEGELKYKKYSDPDSTIYTSLLSDILVIQYENGVYEVVQAHQLLPVYSVDKLEFKRDSSAYYKYKNTLSINAAGFFIGDVSLQYQREFYHNNFGLVVPLAVGVTTPNVVDNTSNFQFLHKQFETGVGVYYYSGFNNYYSFYIGPLMRYMVYNCRSTYAENSITTSKDVKLNRLAGTLTTGFMLRSKSRINLNIFLSWGYRYDKVIDPLINPATNTAVLPGAYPVAFVLWPGFNLGFGF